MLQKAKKKIVNCQTIQYKSKENEGEKQKQNARFVFMESISFFCEI